MKKSKHLGIGHSGWLKIGAIARNLLLGCRPLKERVAGPEAGKKGGGFIRKSFTYSEVMICGRASLRKWLERDASHIFSEVFPPDGEILACRSSEANSALQAS